ncbi:intracellular protein transport protein USO1 [Pyrus ussuriensis x Pyrus communis]|uniref:Intracellular protein transport protein USO1 n=1 Tax=Pyrus ussuriensis x Pyrus communis TaxID=2448454 RepID=A0A5N5FIL7_9ROSA|nr:intracellular protein transport protein USO1 [Pyrus ussuriensis x Pyrus communis]
MLEKIGLPAKPSLRGNTWAVDVHLHQSQGSLLLLRCGGLFCNSCTQQRMLLRGQGDAPVRICDPCKKLEEAARFERYGHKSRAGRGSSKLTSNHEDEVLDEILSSDRKELGQESNSNVSNVFPVCREPLVVHHVQVVNKIPATMGAFKRGKELERQADTLEISLRKERRKVLLSANVAESQIKDGPSESGRRNKATPPLKELGWSDMDLLDENKKQASLSLEGELSSLLGEKALMLKRDGKLTEAKEELKRAKILEKELEEQEFLAEAEDSDDELSALIRSMDDDKQEEFSIQYEQEGGFNFDHLINAADDLGGNFEVTDEDMEDPEISAALQSLGWSQDSNNLETSPPQIPSIDREALLSEIQLLKREALNHKRAGNVQQAMTQLKKAKLLERDLESLESQEGNVANDPARIHKQAADKSSQSPMNGSMRKDMPGTVGSKVPDLAHELPNVSAGLPVADEEGENVTDQDMHDPAYLSMLKNLGWNDDDNEGTNSFNLSQGPERPEPSKVNVGKSNNTIQDRSQLEEQIKAEKVKAVNFKRAGKQAEALDALRKAKLLEKKLNSPSSK